MKHSFQSSQKWTDLLNALHVTPFNERIKLFYFIHTLKIFSTHSWRCNSLSIAAIKFSDVNCERKSKKKAKCWWDYKSKLKMKKRQNKIQKKNAKTNALRIVTQHCNDETSSKIISKMNEGRSVSWWKSTNKSLTLNTNGKSLQHHLFYSFVCDSKKSGTRMKNWMIRFTGKTRKRKKKFNSEKLCVRCTVLNSRQKFI